MQLGTVPLYRINMFRCTDGKTKETPPAPSSVDEVVRLFNEGAEPRSSCSSGFI